MSDNNGWPGEPGVPLNPERNGLHWIQHYNDDPITYEWCATYNEWFLGPNTDYGEGWQKAEYVGINYKYLGPCLTPAEMDARVKEARRDALEEAAQECDKRGAATSADAIRALGEKE
jgi:hypothetical protein